MDIREALQTYLEATAALTAVVGDRIFHRVIPEGTVAPAVVWTIVSVTPTHTMKTDSGPYAAHVQVDCYGMDDDPELAAAQVSAALTDYSGVMGGAGGVTVQRVLYEGERDLFDESAGRNGVSQDYTIWYTV